MEVVEESRQETSTTLAGTGTVVGMFVMARSGQSGINPTFKFDIDDVAPAILYLPSSQMKKNIR